jgi:hypothetical protein
MRVICRRSVERLHHASQITRMIAHYVPDPNELRHVREQVRDDRERADQPGGDESEQTLLREGQYEAFSERFPTTAGLWR